MKEQKLVIGGSVSPGKGGKLCNRVTSKEASDKMYFCVFLRLCASILVKWIKGKIKIFILH